MKLNRPGYVVLLALTFAFARNAGGAYAYLTFYLTAGTFLASACWAGLLRWGVRVRVEAPARERYVGDEAEVFIELSNLAPLPAAWTLVRDHSGRDDQPPSETPCTLPPRGRRTLTKRIACEQRGRYRTGPIELILTDPLGLFAIHRRVGGAGSFTVYPRPLPLRNPIPAAGPAGGRRRATPRSERDPAHSAGARPLAPGDSPRDIHWKMTARRGRFFVKEYDPGGGSLLRIVLDLSRAAHGGSGSFRTDELAVSAALGLSLQALRAGQAVELVASNARRLHVAGGYGRAQYFRLREGLVDAAADGEQPLPDWFAGILPQLERGAAAFAFITPDLTPATVALLARLRRSANEVILVHPLPPDRGLPAGRGRLRLIRTLRRAGVTYLPLAGGREARNLTDPGSAWPDAGAYPHNA